MTTEQGPGRSEANVNSDRVIGRGARAGVLCLALAAGLAACDSDVAPAFEVDGTGSIEGVVFFDADRNGVYDPSAGDSSLSGVGILVRERGTQQTLAGGTGTTGANGRFVISGVEPGTHDLVVDTATAGGLKFCQNPAPVTVYIGERQFSSVPARIACIISIAAAEQTRGQTVVVQGIITSAPGQTRSQYTYIQDETGGIRIFSAVPEGKGLEIGDRIEVTGLIAEFSGDLQLAGTVSLGAIQKNAFQITPESVTTGQLRAAGSDPAARELGLLVTIRGARIETAFGANGANGRNVWIDDGSGLAQIRFESAMFPGSTTDAQAALTAAYPVGKCYDITGVTGAFNGDGQIFPRTLADIQEVTCQ